MTGTQDNAVAQGGPDRETHWQTVVGRHSDGALDVRSGDGRSQEVAYPASDQSVLYSMRNTFELLSRHEFERDESGTVQETVISVPLKRAGNAEPLSGLSQSDKDNDRPKLRPLAVNAVPSAADRLLLGGHDLYESRDRGETIRKLTTGVSAPGDGMYVSLVYGGRQPGERGVDDKPNVIYAGRRDALYVREANANLSDSLVDRTPVNAQDGFFATYITDIAVRHDDWRIAYVSDHNRVWRTQDAGATWHVVLRTDQLVGAVWSLAVATEAGRDVLIMGTDNGVYRAIAPDDPRTGKWTVTRFGRNLPNLPVLDVHYYPLDRGGMLVAGTLGRGTWIVENLTGRLSRPSTLRIVGDDPGPTGDDRFRLQRSATNPLMLEVYVNGEQQQFRSRDPQPAPAWATTDHQIPVAAVESIEVLGGAGDDWLRIDSTHGPLDVTVTFNGQAGADNQLRLFHGGTHPDADVFGIRWRPAPLARPPVWNSRPTKRLHVQRGNGVAGGRSAGGREPRSFSQRGFESGW